MANWCDARNATTHRRVDAENLILKRNQTRKESKRMWNDTYLIVVLPANRVWWLWAKSDDTSQIDGTAHANKDFTTAQDRRARLYINDKKDTI